MSGYLSAFGWCAQPMRQVEMRLSGFAGGSAPVARDLGSDLNGHITPKTCGGMT